MIDFKNLIDYLPYYFKDSDTYKDEYGKGLLERFLNICGDYLSDCPLKDLDSYLSNLNNLDKIPELYLPYYWEFLGSFPFINTPVFRDAASLDLKSFKSISEDNILVKYGDNPFSTLKVDVRRLLKYSISLYRIRGTETFLKVLISLFRIPSTTITVNDKQVFTLKNPVYDLDKTNVFNYYDEEYKYDEVIDYPDMPVIKFKITTGYMSEDELSRWKDSITKLFKYFAPYNSKQEFEFYYNGELLKEARSITLSHGDSPIDNYVRINNQLGILVDITGDLKEYQIAVTKDENEPDESLWSDPLTASKIYARYRGCELIPLYYWARLYEDPDIKTGPLRIDQKVVNHTYNFSILKITTDLEGNNAVNIENGNLELSLDNPQYYVWFNISKSTTTLTSDKRPLTESTNGLLIYDEYNDTIIKTGDLNPKPFVKISEEGVYRFYAVENPYKVITLNVTKLKVSYNVEFDPESIYFNINDGIKYYKSESLSSDTVSDVKVKVTIGGNEVDGIILMVDSVKVTIDASSNSVNDTSLSNKISSELRARLSDGVKSGDSIQLDGLFTNIPLEELNRASKISVQLRTNDLSSIGIFTLNNVNLYTYKLGILQDGEFKESNGQIEYNQGTRVTIAVKFEGKDSIIDKAINSLSNEGSFKLKLPTANPVLSKVPNADSLYSIDYILPYKDNDYDLNVKLYWDENVSMNILAKSVNTTEVTYLVVGENEYKFTSNMNADPVSLLVDKEAKIKFILKNQDNIIPPGSSSRVLLDNGSDVEYMYNNEYTLGIGTYRFKVIDIETQGFTYINVEVKGKPTVNPLKITSISCNPTQSILSGSSGATTNISMTYTGDLSSTSQLDYMLKSVTDTDDPESFKTGEQIPYEKPYTAYREGVYTFSPYNEEFSHLECKFEVKR